MTAESLIKKFNLAPLPGEGGFFRQTYQSQTSTAIYYLLTPGNFSAFHLLPHDEIYHFYFGDPVEVVTVTESGELKRTILGNSFENGQIPQILVTGGAWQASKLQTGGSVALLGTTMAPGFRPEEFVLGERAELIKKFPQHSSTITELTRV